MHCFIGLSFSEGIFQLVQEHLEAAVAVRIRRRSNVAGTTSTQSKLCFAYLDNFIDM